MEIYIVFAFENVLAVFTADSHNDSLKANNN